VLRLLSRRPAADLAPSPDAASPLAVTILADVAPVADRPATACALSTCLAGARATVLEMRCGEHEACRLRALGLCEGASVSVVRSRDCTLLEVRGSRLALSPTIASGITVLPVA
jgi:Fe2+ transport system protein FeoA